MFSLKIICKIKFLDWIVEQGQDWSDPTLRSTWERGTTFQCSDMIGLSGSSSIMVIRKRADPRYI